MFSLRKFFKRKSIKHDPDAALLDDAFDISPWPAEITHESSSDSVDAAEAAGTNLQEALDGITLAFVAEPSTIIEAPDGVAAASDASVNLSNKVANEKPDIECVEDFVGVTNVQSLAAVPANANEPNASAILKASGAELTITNKPDERSILASLSAELPEPLLDAEKVDHMWEHAEPPSFDALDSNDDLILDLEEEVLVEVSPIDTNALHDELPPFSPDSLYAGATDSGDDGNTDWLFDFDDTPPTSVDDDEPVVALTSRLIEEKASYLMGELSTIRREDIESTFDRCIQLLEEFPHHVSYMAMRQLLQKGLSLTDLEEVAALKSEWRNNPSLWAHRRRGEVNSHSLQKNALSWRTASALIDKFGLINSLERLQEDWFNNWCRLRPPPLDEPALWIIYRFFAAYLDHIATTGAMPSFTADPDLWHYAEVTERVPHKLIRPSGSQFDAWEFHREDYYPYQSQTEFQSRRS